MIKEMFTDRLRSLGGLGVGLAVAVAGAVGVAVGQYSLPNPLRYDVASDAYERVGQFARALHREELDGGFRELRIVASRDASAGYGVNQIWDENPNDANVAVDVWFSAHWAECDFSFNCSPLGSWQGGFRGQDVFRFDPLLRSATFVADVPEMGEEGEPTGNTCAFSVTWTGEGSLAPSHHRNNDQHVGSGGNPAIKSNDGSTQVSRVAPADVESCAFDGGGLPGYLSVGEEQGFAHLHSFPRG